MAHPLKRHPSEAREYVTFSEALERYSFGEAQLRELLRSGSIPAKRVGVRKVIIATRDIARWFDAQPGYCAA